jgi:hypothetical protein
MNAVETREWTYLRAALVVVAVLAVADVAAWKVHDWRNPPPTRLASTIRCLETEKGLPVTLPAGDPLADSAGGGSLKTTVEGNVVTVALASSDGEALRIERYYRAVGGDLTDRLERRGSTVYLWRFTSSPTQRQAMYECQY